MVTATVQHGPSPQRAINRQVVVKLAGVTFAAPFYEISIRNLTRRLGDQCDFRVGIRKPVDTGLRQRRGAGILLYPSDSIKSHPGGLQSSQQCTDAERVI